MSRDTANAPEFYEVKFNNEENWRNFLEETIRNDPNAYLEPTGSLGFFLEKALLPWVERHLNRGSYTLVAIEVSEDPDNEDAPVSGFRHRGKALDPNYDDPHWLTAERDRLRRENQELRRKLKD